MSEALQIRCYGDASLPTLIYLPGLHGDWTLVSSFRAAVAGRVRFVEFAYPRSLTTSAADYAGWVLAALSAQGITHGWLIGESFGSQVAWAILEQIGRAEADFSVAGLVLVGGFVKHPWPWGARLLRWQAAHTPAWLAQGLLRGYEAYAGFRHRHAPETRASIREFVERRTPLDGQAIRARLELIATNDPRPIARRTTLPVHYLAGLVDPLVPWPFVRAWLRRHCPGYRGGCTLLRADHNALATRPGQASQVILGWMQDRQPQP